MGIVKQHGVEFVKDSMKWWRAFVECQSPIFPPLTWEQFHAFLFEKYVLWALSDFKTDEFLALE